MTTPDLDQELQRLFSAARVATAPGSGARERIRAGLSPRLASEAATPRRARGSASWLGAALAVLGLCGIALWLTRTPPANELRGPLASHPSASPTRVVAPPAAPAPPSATALPSAPVRSSSPPPSKQPPAASTRVDNSAEELPLVRAMQQALRSGEPQQALALAANHERRFPRGTLVEEREGVRAVARCQLATPDARAPILAAFARRFATSPYVARVKAACQ
jgi:hypothetical protein